MCGTNNSAVKISCCMCGAAVHFPELGSSVTKHNDVNEAVDKIIDNPLKGL